MPFVVMASFLSFLVWAQSYDFFFETPPKRGRKNWRVVIFFVKSRCLFHDEAKKRTTPLAYMRCRVCLSSCS